MASELYVETLKGLTSGANANKVIIPSGQTLDITDWSPPAGTTLQVVIGRKNTATTTASGTLIDTGLEATITPSSASSNILVLVNMASVWKNSANTSVYFSLLRGATEISKMGAGYIAYTSNTGTNGVGSACALELDSPNTTLATTYKVQFKSETGTSQVGFSGSNTESSIVLMEIAG